ncbi:hypothetical protein Tco_1039906 [Tanacetum coccineum]
MSYDEIRPMFKEEYNKIKTLFKKDTEVEKTKTKRVAEETLLQESFKKLRTVEASRLRKYWKIIRVRNITEAYQGFEDMLKGFDREDLVTLWSLVKERFRSAEPTEDMERALWVELKRVFEPDKDDVLWKLQKYMHDPLTWRLKIQRQSWNEDSSLDDLRRNEAHGALSDVCGVPSIDKADEMILQDTLQVSLAKQKIREEQEARENVELVNKHLASVEEEQIEKREDVHEKMFIELQGRYGYLFEHLKAQFLSRKSFDTLDGHLQEVMVESLPTMVDKHIKEQVEKQVHEQVKVQVPVYVAKGLLFKRQQNKEETNKMIAKAMLQERGDELQAKISSQIQKAIDTNIPSLVDASVRSYMSGYILYVHLAQPQYTIDTLDTSNLLVISCVSLKGLDDLWMIAHPEGRIVQSGEKTYEFMKPMCCESRPLASHEKNKANHLQVIKSK